ncbi:glycoside hydrolase/deacetylase [Dacryopinax primogenitus]|uniref:chitin deacetylase n=1 Tax=Dacryopinax primogenitus (strain DJM 731) TaxID=1858805 RepID=M5FTC0_DACPD|nr:glycoside hydrolase/deacetylase [Dacryopinax primogenitus]EJU00871.1 glycoside hydrolase/deacetylase [Dacryopinax primogenitus]
MLSLPLTLLPLLSLPLLSLASPLPFYQPHTSPAAALFRRQNASLPAVGTDAWTALYPSGSGTPSTIPQAWLDALAAAENSGLIPNISQSTLNSQSGMTTYPDGQDPTGTEVCSFTYQCNVTTDIVNPPEGVIALTFDDGPIPGPSDTLYSFLYNNSQHATHFMIGVNILGAPTQFLTAFGNNKDHIGVHTWSHPYLTTLSNDQVVSELGWTVQIIHDSTGGLIPSCYRPPYGDTDNRVRAIAEHVFGLKTVTWNQDSEDWMIGDGTTEEAVEGSLTNWVVDGGGVQGQGLLILEHELMDTTVQAFMDIYPSMKANWTVVCRSSLF